jgi:hypothetical protein
VVAYASFNEVDRLNAAALKALLVGGEPAERVWAAWALGLRHDPGFAHELRATAAEEPHAGVRRHLVVVLAGAGESRSVMTMAMHDPDERVRATALQYVARLARPGDADANEVLARALADGAPVLRLGCIAGLRADAPPRLWQAADACVDSADRDLRWTAYETVVRQRQNVRPAPELTRVLANREPERSTRWSALELLHERDGADGLLRLLDDAALDARVVPEVIEALHARGVQRAWSDVERLLARFAGSEWIHRALQLLIGGGEGPGRAELLRLFVTDRLEPRLPEQMRQEVSTRLRKALDDNRGPLHEAERGLRQALADLVDKRTAEARADPDFFDDPGDIDPDLLPVRGPGDPPIDPLSLPWFCSEERDILARLAPLDVH